MDQTAAVKQQSITPHAGRRWIYPGLLAAIYAAWSVYMFTTGRWALFLEHWPVTLTMSLGSFVAGATAEGGAAVAFPVFTKVLQIPSTDARTFGLMIQSVGMMMAATIILVQKINFLPAVVGWVSLGGVAGMIAGSYLFSIPPPYPRVIFTFAATTFGVALAVSRWSLRLKPRSVLPAWNNRYRVLFLLLGVLGGAFAANTGSGIDMLTFVVLTLASTQLA